MPSFIEPHHIPFPYEPYALQCDAVNRIRTFLETDTESLHRGESARVMVLESPTGTGKSHMLLSGVLSHVYSTDTSEGEQLPLTDPQQAATTTAEKLLQESRIQEEVRRLTEERRERVRILRRQARALRRSTYMSATQSATGTSVPDGLGEVEMAFDEHVATILSDANAPTGYMSSSSSTSSSSSSQNHSDDDEDNVEASLASRIPLRKPKIYLASRTHTQLQQLMDDLGSTEYALRPQKLRNASSHDGSSHRIFAVHMAGRQHLCINARVRAAASSDGMALNELCVEAMQYERSSTGRSARRRARRDAVSGLSSLATARGGTVDLEDLGDGADPDALGCRYCAKEKLQAMLDYIRHRRTSTQGTSGECSVDPRVPGVKGPRSDFCDAQRDFLTLEEMKELGTSLQACPYLTSRLLTRMADVVLVPYGFLVDEDQRNVLLGGAATNPATLEDMATLENQVRLHGGSLIADDRSPCSTGTILFRRRAQVAALRAQHLEAKTKQKSRKQHSNPWAATVHEALPNFCGDYVVMDEAHNVADLCRSVSTSALPLSELMGVRHLLDLYLRTYESRLLTKNKQRLRELILFFKKFMDYVQQLDGFGDPEGMKTPDNAVSPPSVVKSVHDVVFDAGVDHVDVFHLVAFLSDSRLSVKVRGLIQRALLLEDEAKTCREAELRSTTASQQLNRARMAHRNKDHLHGPSPLGSDTPSPPDVKASTGGVHAWLDVLVPNPSLSSRDFAQRCGRWCSRAMQRVERFLRWLADSNDSSRFLVERSDGITSIKLLQLNPGLHTLYPLLRSVEAVILAGGTMTPIALTCSPLLPLCKPSSNTTVDEVLVVTEPHVVPSSSIRLWPLATGPSGLRFDFTRKVLSRQDSQEVQFRELAVTLLNLSRVLPPEGVVVFFPSHNMEQAFSDYLVRSGYYEQIDEVKHIFRERGTTAVPAAATSVSSTSVVDDGLSTAERVSIIFAAYSAWIRRESPREEGVRATTTFRGAMLFAVMGGRLSEGINFMNELGRAVVVVGLPYANPGDVELRLFLEQVAQTKRSSESGSSLGPSHDLLTSQKASSPHVFDLYTDLCMRTVNQCIGRCIRHAHDYAVIILVDGRYADRPAIRQGISSWLQPSFAAGETTFGDCFRGVREFFQSHRSA